MSVIALRKEIQGLHDMMKPDLPSSLVIFLDENGIIHEIQGQDVTGCTQDEINKMLDSVPVLFYLPMPDPEDLE